MKGRRQRLRWVALGVVAALVAMAGALFYTRARVLPELVPELVPTFTEDELRSVVVTTLQSEAPQSFLVTGHLNMWTISSGEDVKYLLPDLGRIPLGTARATVRIPGRALYGFDVRKLRPEHVQVGEDGVVDVTLPEIAVYSVAPDLERMEIRTEVGWQRRLLDTGREVEQPALRLALEKAQQSLRREAVRHVSTSAQPRVHTAKAIEAMLRPALVAAGVEDPRFRFRIGPRIVMEPEG